jgi:hypothetical protein
MLARRKVNSLGNSKKDSRVGGIIRFHGFVGDLVADASNY